ncbi:putative 28S ribosomal protein S35, mitochondrial isoform X3 [Apostichopus japonicus]|uniref:Putative 28S ribosomal protein S35, mitochondrial isoform X3 n=1 Tax=Stichopus japonicus TaxID=307972 RepID=A0A2G8KK00_STIJA|nr:putative 28S ribosomal protein S35, mitochondrial isoform X3 [Apostichopus japonicus]
MNMAFSSHTLHHGSGVTRRLCLLCKDYFTRNIAITASRHHGSLVSTSLPDVDTEIEKVSVHSLRGKAMRAMQDRLKKRQQMPPSREVKMKDTQVWSDVYPTAATFKWSAVPLSVRMGYPVRRGIPPHKLGNAELMKIPNFLHLTPPAVKKHCAALKELCTDWPAELNSDEVCDKHLPIAMETSDYVFSGPSVRSPKARVVQLKVKLSVLPLDKHARWKLIQLLGKSYDKKTDEICLTADRCPVRKQNQDYAMYLLSVLFHEAHITEPWEETDATEDDMEEYTWDSGQSKANILRVKKRMIETDGNQSQLSEDDICSTEDVEKFKMAYTELCNNPETQDNLASYKSAVLDLVGLKQKTAVDT